MNWSLLQVSRQHCRRQSRSPQAMASPAPKAPIDPERAKESNTAMILTVTGLFHGLALIVVALRVYTRAHLVKVMGGDDYVMIGAAVRIMSRPSMCIDLRKYSGESDNGFFYYSSARL